jgi:hypothetical protein
MTYRVIAHYAPSPENNHTGGIEYDYATYREGLERARLEVRENCNVEFWFIPSDPEHEAMRSVRLNPFAGG